MDKKIKLNVTLFILIIRYAVPRLGQCPSTIVFQGFTDMRRGNILQADFLYKTDSSGLLKS